MLDGFSISTFKTKTCTVGVITFLSLLKQINKHKDNKFIRLISLTFCFALLMARLQNHQPSVTENTAEGIKTKKRGNEVE